MPQNTPNTPNEPSTGGSFPILYSTAKVDNLSNPIFKYGSNTNINRAPEGSPEETSLKIEHEEGHEYDFRGLGAYEAVTNEHRGVQMRLNVHFFVYKGTKAVVAILKD